MNMRKGPETVVSRLRTLKSFALLSGRDLRAEFFRLALVTHHFEGTLGLFISGRDFRLYLGGGLFHFRREAHVAVVFHARSGRDEAADNDVLFQPTQVIDLTVDARFGQYARGLLE